MSTETHDEDREDREDRGGEVLPFPSGRVDEPAVLDAELVELDQPVPVDPRPVKPALAWRRGEPTRHPIVAPWLRARESRRAAGRWALRYIWHSVAFHSVRLPLYVLALAAYAPAGAVRLARSVARWVSDADSRPLRAAAVDGKLFKEHEKLQDDRDRRIKVRALGLLAAALAVWVVSAVVLAPRVSPWVSARVPDWVPDRAGYVALAVVLVLVLGRYGRPSDRPVVGTAVSVPTVPRLTSEVVVRGLAALGIPGISQAVAKNTTGTGWFPAPITRDGPGWRADVELPHGVTVTDVIERRDRLASGLRRPLGCVWPEPATEEHPGRLVLWVGDESLSQQKPAPWPLARRGQVDLFAAFPFGQDQRGRPVPLDLMYGNLLIGSLPGAGKTMALRIPLLAAALDPTAELRIFELKGSGDLGALEQVAHHYGSGPGDETIEACIESLREVYADLTRRASTISALPKDLAPENKVIAALARKRALRLHPVIVAVDECQELFSHPDYGKEAGALCTAIIKRGRALGTILLLATQRPDKDSLPTGVSANVGIRFCLRVMGQTENDMVLGTSSYKNGLRATMFTPKDRGIGYLAGASDEPQITRTYYVDNPGAEAVAVRARALREAAGTLSGAAIGETSERTPAADLLEDLRVVFATAERMWNEDIVTGLAELRPTVYGDWTAAVLARALRERYQIETRQTWIEGRNRQGVHAEQVHAALAGRVTPAIEPGGHLGDA